MEYINENIILIPTKNMSVGTELTAVLTKDNMNKYAVYLGIGCWEWIMGKGVKLSFQEAKTHFPLLREEEYRK